MYKNENLKEEIRDKIKLSQVISKNLSLKKKDKSNFIALCPFHKEKTPSFSISDEKGFYHCFGCGKNGDVFSYVMETENVGFLDALSNLAEQVGIKMSDFNKIKVFKFRQLPIVWRYPFINIFCSLISPFIPVRTQNKFLRWSRELMLIGYAQK